MDKAVEQGLALVDDMTPAPAIKRAREMQLASPSLPKPSQVEQNRKSMESVGNGSYSRLGPAESSNKEKFEHAIRHRNRMLGQSDNNTTHCLPSAHLDLCITTDNKKIMELTARDLSIGAMMTGAIKVNMGKGLAARKLNLLGEIDGVACIVNCPDRLRRLKQAGLLSTSFDALNLARETARTTRAAAKSAKDATRKAASEVQAPIIDLLRAAGLWPWAPPGKKPSSSITIAVLTAYLKKHHLSKEIPAVPKPKSKPNLMAFFSELCEQVGHRLVLAHIR
jgi:hypothetical protein